MRGKPRRLQRHGLQARFIPAHAGKTDPAGNGAPTFRVHPRACGENHGTWSRVSAVNGSSPRMRGKLATTVSGVTHRRFIPAHAGKTLVREGGGGWDAVHPRACGENPGGAGSRRAVRGSSPRMRGKLRGLRRRPGQGRFIPAHAGKTAEDERLTWRSQVHPRACGENFYFPYKMLEYAGSSPRMRGKLRPGGAGGDRLRFIPTHAGKTPPRLPGPRVPPVHPRACGENTFTSWRAV